MDFKQIITSSTIINTIRKAAGGEIEAYLVGGFVRDLLLERKSKIKDIDVVCVGSGIELAKRLKNLLGRDARLAVFKNFGTAQVKYHDAIVEFVGARKESYRRDSRKPIIEDGTIEDDQNRRDFTINAMAISLNETNLGELIDPFNGLSDLKNKIIKTPLDPAITFSDDPLRIMRAIRFAAQLNFDIEHETYQAICKNYNRLKIVSQERITDEFNKILLAPTPSYGFKLLFHTGVLKLTFTELVRLQGVDSKNGQKHKDNFYHTLKVLDNISVKSNDLWLRWAALLHDIAKPATKRFDPVNGWTFHGHEDLGARMVPQIFKRFKLPLNEKMKYVQKLVRLHLRPIALVSDEITDSALRRLLYEAGNDIEDLLKLCKADITSKNHEKVKRYIKNFDKVSRKLVEVEERDHVRNFQPPVTGEIIMDYFDISPSKIVGEIKDAIKEAILEGKIGNNFDEAYVLMKELGNEKGLKHDHKGK
jgi:putative nucleotidyltransferase with HDIG domain